VVDEFGWGRRRVARRMSDGFLGSDATTINFAEEDGWLWVCAFEQP
jgi:hypothetical protein